MSDSVSCATAATGMGCKRLVHILGVLIDSMKRHLVLFLFLFLDLRTVLLKRCNATTHRDETHTK